MLVGVDPDIDDESLEYDIQGVSDVLRQIADARKPPPPPPPVEPVYKVLHRVCCHRNPNPQYFVDIDPPYPSRIFETGKHLENGNRVRNIELYLEQNRAAIFIVICEYTCCGDRLPDPEVVVPKCTSEKLIILSEGLLRYLIQAANISTKRKMLYPTLQLRFEIEKPHLWTFLGMEDLEETIEALKHSEDIKHCRLFLEYFRDGKRDQHNHLKKLLSENLITADLLEYLFVSYSFAQVSLFRMHYLTIFLHQRLQGN